MTVEVRPGLLVAVDRHGTVLGVERTDGEVRAADLAEVIAAMRWVRPRSAAD